MKYIIAVDQPNGPRYYVDHVGKLRESMLTLSKFGKKQAEAVAKNISEQQWFKDADVPLAIRVLPVSGRV
jgi:hypothetical protein